MRPIILCDPGLLMPPVDSEITEYRTFWERLVAWAADRRVLLGVQSRQAVLEKLEALGWPDYLPPQCPEALSRDARRAFTNFLLSVADNPCNAPPDIPALDPEYVLDGEFGSAFALDIGEHGGDQLLGAASTHPHWARPAEVVKVTPPPPSEVQLIVNPGQKLLAEQTYLVRRELRRKRVTIIGGKETKHVIEAICDLCSVDENNLRWVEAEPEKNPNLDCLLGVRVENDVVVCITGAIGHSDSATVIRRCRRGGMEPILVEKRSDIERAIRLRYGRDGYGRGSATP